MTDAWTYRDALRTIWARSGYDRGYVSDPFWGDEAAGRGLRRTVALLERLGRPQDRYAIVHVAGSKGKGSTCAFAAAMLRAAGHRTGLTTSPHLHSFRERIAIDDKPVDEATFAALTRRAVTEAEGLERSSPELGEVTAFELLTAMALDTFAAAGCEVAVVEVGMGGRLDATNVVASTVAAITALDLEHTAVLGRTLPEIAREKAGIVKPGRPVVVSPQDPAALAVIEATAADRGSPLLLAGRDWWWEGTWEDFAVIGPWGRYAGLRSGLPGIHQMENASTALAAVSLLGDRFPLSEGGVRTGLAEARWPGRFERVRPEHGPEIVLDGAHTPASARAVAATMVAVHPDRRAVVVLGLMGDKDAASVARALMPVAARVVATHARSPRAMPATEVGAGAAAAGFAVEVAADVAAALSRASELAGPAGLVLVTGSLSVVAEAREALGLARPDPPVGED